MGPKVNTIAYIYIYIHIFVFICLCYSRRWCPERDVTAVCALSIFCVPCHAHLIRLIGSSFCLVWFRSAQMHVWSRCAFAFHTTCECQLHCYACLGVLSHPNVDLCACFLSHVPRVSCFALVVQDLGPLSPSYAFPVLQSGTRRSTLCPGALLVCGLQLFFIMSCLSAPV